MATVEIIRIIVGIAFILFGLGVYAYDRLYDMKYSEFRYSPLSWIYSVGGGILISAYTVKVCILFSAITLIAWILEKLILSKFIENN